ncbi:NBS-containing resistance-like protein [Tanacetum coccineum]
MPVTRYSSGLFLVDTTFFRDIVARDDMSYCNLHSTPVFVKRSTLQGVANVVADTAWLRNLLLELHCPLSRAIVVCCGNVSARIAIGKVHVLHVPSTRQFADIFLKGLPSQSRKCSLGLGVFR